jgi:hypothetical protein
MSVNAKVVLLVEDDMTLYTMFNPKCYQQKILRNRRRLWNRTFG